MKTIIFLLSFLTTQILAQSGEFRVISCQGNVSVQSKNSEDLKRLYSGQTLKADGVLLLDEGSSIKIISKEKPILLDQAGEYDLQSLFTSSNKMSMSFTGKFWQFIMDGLKGSDSKMNMKNYYKDYMAVSGGVKGYVDNERRLVIQQPYSGIITDEILHVAWHYEGEATLFKVILEEQETAHVLYEIKTQDNTIDLVIGDELLENEKQYYLKVENAEGISASIPVSWSKVDEEIISKRLKSIVGYEEANASEQGWMRAVVLEMEGYNQQAYAQLKGLLEKDPDNLHLKKLMATFLIRQGEIVEAEDLMDLK